MEVGVDVEVLVVVVGVSYKAQAIRLSDTS